MPTAVVSDEPRISAKRHGIQGAQVNERLCIVGAGVIALVFAANIVWILRHRFPLGWDECYYIGQSYIDVFSARAGVHSWWTFAGNRPPAYRMLALPIAMIFGASPTLLRLVSLSTAAAAIAFTWLTTRRIAGRTAATFAATLLALNACVLGTTRLFGTEGPLYLATAATLYFLLRSWTAAKADRVAIVGLGVALGLGAYAKATFPAFAAPVLLTSLILEQRKLIVGPSAKLMAAATLLGTAIALPWWAVNWRAALSFGIFSARYQRGVLNFHDWFYGQFLKAVGVPVGLLLLVTLAAAVVWKVRHPGPMLGPIQKYAIYICVAGTLPLVIGQLCSKNLFIRMVSPVFFTLAIAIAILAKATPMFRKPILVASLGLMLVAQLLLNISSLAPWQRTTLGPFPSSMQFEHWDWNKLRLLCKQVGIPQPRLALLGNGEQFNMPQIAFPWVAANENVQPLWLWRFEQGQPYWPGITNAALESDVVVTIPNYRGDPIDKQELDNSYNAQFASYLAGSGFFEQFSLEMGEADPVWVAVLLRRRTLH